MLNCVCRIQHPYHNVNLCVMCVSMQPVWMVVFCSTMVPKSPPSSRRAQCWCAVEESMGQCVMTTGMSWRPGWCVHNWDTHRVSHTKMQFAFQDV